MTRRLGLLLLTYLIGSSWLGIPLSPSALAAGFTVNRVTVKYPRGSALWVRADSLNLSRAFPKWNILVHLGVEKDKITRCRIDLAGRRVLDLKFAGIPNGAILEAVIEQSLRSPTLYVGDHSAIQLRGGESSELAALAESLGQWLTDYPVVATLTLQGDRVRDIELHNAWGHPMMTSRYVPMPLRFVPSFIIRRMKSTVMPMHERTRLLREDLQLAFDHARGVHQRALLARWISELRPRNVLETENFLYMGIDSFGPDVLELEALRARTPRDFLSFITPTDQHTFTLLRELGVRLYADDLLELLEGLYDAGGSAALTARLKLAQSARAVDRLPGVVDFTWTLRLKTASSEQVITGSTQFPTRSTMESDMRYSYAWMKPAIESLTLKANWNLVRHAQLDCVSPLTPIATDSSRTDP